MRLKSAALAMIVLAFLMAACSKKPEETSNPTAPTGTTAGTTEAAKGPAAAESTKPPSLTQHPAPKPVTLPEGTVLTVRLNEKVSSKGNSSGDRFTATVAEPVQVDGKDVIPKGAAVTGTVTDAKALGKIKGAATLRLVLDSVTIKDTKYDIQTSAVARSMKGKGKRTAEFGGGGAAAGALIGGLAGGGKGLGIGLLAGGAAGLAGGAFTGNKDIVLPAETMLSFKLLKPVDIKM
jgi:hypothetical protein